MKASFTYSQRLGLLSLLLGLLLIVCIRQGSALRDKVQAYQRIKPQLDQLASAPIIFAQQNQALALAEGAFRRQQDRQLVRDHGDFVHYLNRVCKAKGVKLVSLPVVQREAQATWQLAQEQFSLEGSYQAILQVCYQLEAVDQIGKFARLQLETQTYLLAGKRQVFLLAHCMFNRIEAHHEDNP